MSVGGLGRQIKLPHSVEERGRAEKDNDGFVDFAAVARRVRVHQRGLSQARR